MTRNRVSLGLGLVDCCPAFFLEVYSQLKSLSFRLVTKEVNIADQGKKPHHSGLVECLFPSLA